MRIMERVAAAVAGTEPVLLVGETGTGKTTLVQEIAKQVGAKMVVLNLSQQTDSSDLVGGFRPIHPADAVLGLLGDFTGLVQRTWRRGNNDDFMARVLKLASKRKWAQVVRAFRAALDKAGVVAASAPAAAMGDDDTRGAKKQRKASGVVLDDALCDDWQRFSRQLDSAEATAAAAEGGFAFGFSEGALVKAVREGWWLLLDEVNLAPPEVRAEGVRRDAACGGRRRCTD